MWQRFLTFILWYCLVYFLLAGKRTYGELFCDNSFQHLLSDSSPCISTWQYCRETRKVEIKVFNNYREISAIPLIGIFSSWKNFVHHLQRQKLNRRNIFSPRINKINLFSRVVITKKIKPCEDLTGETFYRNVTSVINVEVVVVSFLLVDYSSIQDLCFVRGMLMETTFTMILFALAEGSKLWISLIAMYRTKTN